MASLLGPDAALPMLLVVRVYECTSQQQAGSVFGVAPTIFSPFALQCSAELAVLNDIGS
jgi:hypothetical protein